MVKHSAIPALGRWRQEDQEFKIIFSYLVNPRAIWTTYVCVRREGSKRKTKRKESQEGKAGGRGKPSRRLSEVCAEHSS